MATKAQAIDKFDRNQIKDFITGVEDDIASFLGYELSAGHIIAHITTEHAKGAIGDRQAESLLDDAYHLVRLAKVGLRYARWARKPPAEIELLVLNAHTNGDGD